MPAWRGWCNDLMTRALAWLLPVALALAVTGSAPAAGDTASTSSTTAIAALNAARAARGLDPVVERTELSAAAGAHTADMAKRRAFKLDLPGAPTIRDRLMRAGYVPPASRMLLTNGYPDAELLIEGLLGEDSAADALLDPAIGELGLGHAPGPYRDPGGRIVTHAWLLILAETRITPVREPDDGLLAAVNRARGGRGLPAVMSVAALTAAARDHAGDMVARGFFDHRTPDGHDVADRARRQRYAFRKIGENLAVGQSTPDEVVRAWTDSPGHAAVLYDPELREIGIGYLPGPLHQRPQTFRHVWVAVFGARR